MCASAVMNADIDPVDRTAENAKKFADTNEYVIYGTPIELNEEELETGKKIKRKEDLVATDEKGRRRFHGAFTGGFSAGYFNTCGSEKGWAPSSFVSNRSERGTNNFKDPEYFMDDEDFSEFGIAPKKYSTKSQFEIKRNIKTGFDESLESHQTLKSLVSDEFLTSSFNIVRKITIGFDLMKRLGWKEGRGLGESVSVSDPSKAPSKTYGCELPPHLTKPSSSSSVWITPKEIKTKIPEPKKNLFGIGYISLRSKADTLCDNKKNIPVFKPTGHEKHGIRGTAYGIGALEEHDDEDDIYVEDNINDYDFSIDIKHNSDEEEGHTQKKLWNGFVKPKLKTEYTYPQYNLPVIPTSYSPNPILGNDVSSRYLSGSRVVWSAVARSHMLKEGKEVENQTGNKSQIFDKSIMNSEFLNKKFVSTGQMLDDGLDPIEKGRIEAAKAGRFGKLTRTVIDWQPEEVLCRRFNVNCTNTKYLKAPKQTKAPPLPPNRTPEVLSKFSTHGPLSILNTDYVEPTITASSQQSYFLPDSNLKMTTPAVTSAKDPKDSNIFEDLDKPPIDLYKSVFCEESDDEEIVKISTEPNRYR